MFDGKIGSKRTVDYGGRRSSIKSTEEIRKEREKREIERKRNQAVKIIQRCVRRLQYQKKAFDQFRQKFDKKLSEILILKNALLGKGAVFIVPIETLLQLLQYVLFFYRVYNDTDRLDTLQKFLLESFQCQDERLQYFRAPKDIYQLALFRFRRILDLIVTTIAAMPLEEDSSLINGSLSFLEYVILQNRDFKGFVSDVLSAANGKSFSCICTSIKILLRSRQCVESMIPSQFDRRIKVLVNIVVHLMQSKDDYYGHTQEVRFP